jgi:hypothetical protein
MAFACRAALSAAVPFSLWLCFEANCLPVQGMTATSRTTPHDAQRENGCVADQQDNNHSHHFTRLSLAGSFGPNGFRVASAPASI